MHIARTRYTVYLFLNPVKILKFKCQCTTFIAFPVEHTEKQERVPGKLYKYKNNACIQLVYEYAVTLHGILFVDTKTQSLKMFNIYSTIK